jgi:hypothetical protein
VFDSHSTAIASPSHGGLTPAALGRMYVCASQKSLFRRQTFAPQHKSGGRKPPVASMHAIVIRSRMTHIRFWRYVSPVAPINATATAIRTHTVGGLPTNGARVCRCAFAEPRRADARRSWSCSRSSLNAVRFSLHGDRLTEPRRDHARRSCVRFAIVRAVLCDDACPDAGSSTGSGLAMAGL